MKKSDPIKADIFISYRRDNGIAVAKHLMEILEIRGYNVFLDMDSLSSGDYNTALMEVIENCTDFIIILTHDALDRCMNEDDWVRRELASALRSGKNVIPVMEERYVFPDKLPNDIDGLRWKNGIRVNFEYYDEMIKKLISFLHSKQKKKIWNICRVFLLVFVGTIVLGLTTVGIIRLNNGGNRLGKF